MKKLSRHQMRENAMMLIFEKSFCADTPEEILEIAKETDALHRFLFYCLLLRRYCSGVVPIFCRKILMKYLMREF